MKLTISKNANINYLARIVQVDTFHPHPNADKLKLCTVEGYIISTGIDSVEGIYVYFPVECVINPKFLKYHNLYRKKELNQNPEQSGFFEESGRVKCIKLRGIASEGFIMPINSLISYINDNVSFDYPIGTEFDTINDELFVWKYVIKTNISNSKLGVKQPKKVLNIVENQFRFHVDTVQLQKAITNINLEDIIQISWKEHGTSGIFCNLLTKTDLSFYKKVLNKISKTLFKYPIFPEEHYYKFCSSRKVIKDRKLNPNLTKGYYDCDIWNIAFNVIEEYLQKGLTVYAEIVGYMPNGQMIQKDYDYKCVYNPKSFDYQKMTPKQMYHARLFDIVVYRITYTNVDGKVFEFSTQQVKEFCKKYSLHSVKELYYGRAENLFPNLNINEHWHEEFLTNLRNMYLEQRSVLCNNNVPEEGIVLRREVNGIDVYKLKSINFLEKESKMLDRGEIDIESNQ